MHAKLETNFNEILKILSSFSRSFIKYRTCYTYAIHIAPSNIKHLWPKGNSVINSSLSLSHKNKRQVKECREKLLNEDNVTKLRTFSITIPSASKKQVYRIELISHKFLYFQRTQKRAHRYLNSRMKFM